MIYHAKQNVLLTVRQAKEIFSKRRDRVKKIK